jgi:hypothetical protein
MLITIKSLVVLSLTIDSLRHSNRALWLNQSASSIFNEAFLGAMRLQSPTTPKFPNLEYL